MNDTFAGPETHIADITQVPLDELIASEDSVLAHALRRIRSEIDNPDEVIAGFQNFV